MASVGEGLRNHQSHIVVYDRTIAQAGFFKGLFPYIAYTA
jgi:hypothetical protein